MVASMKITKQDYINANRKGSREAEQMFSTGFVSKHSAHKSKKAYDRKEGKRVCFN